MTQEIRITGSIVHETGDPVSIELARGQRGGYGWTIKVRGKTESEILSRIGWIDGELRGVYLADQQE